MNIATPVIDSLKRGQTVDKVPPLAYFQFNPSTQPFLISLFSYNPKKEMYKLDIPTLVVQGTNDLQANISDARRLFSAAKKGGIVEIQDMNHVLKVVPRDLGENIKSYNKPDLEISHELVESVSKFIKSNG